MKIAAYIIIGLVIFVLIWVIGEELYNTGYIDGKRDGYVEGIMDGKDRDQKREH